MYTPSKTSDCEPVDDPGSCANSELKNININDILNKYFIIKLI